MIKTFDKPDFSYPEKLETERCAIVNFVIESEELEIYNRKKYSPGYRIRQRFFLNNELSQWNIIMNKYDNWIETPDIFIPNHPYADYGARNGYLHVFWSTSFDQEIYAYAYPIISEWEQEYKRSKTSQYEKLEILLEKLFNGCDYNVYIFKFYLMPT